MIKVENIKKIYHVKGVRVPVLQGVSFEIEPGTFGAVCGPSGCGKSTMLLILGALMQPDEGSVIIAERDLLGMPGESRAVSRAELIGFVFQRFHLLPYLTVEENIRAAGIALRRPNADARVEALMKRFGIHGRRNHVPGQLSVGEQQRTAMARALYNEPKVLLADEPTGNLDPENAGLVLNAFVEFAAGGGTVVMVTHHLDAAERADRLWMIRDGLIEKSD
jgi:ABC-type lipoprotein export system ATPase subunit